MAALSLLTYPDAAAPFCQAVYLSVSQSVSQYVCLRVCLFLSFCQQVMFVLSAFTAIKNEYMYLVVVPPDGSNKRHWMYVSVRTVGWPVIGQTLNLNNITTYITT